MTKIKDIPNGTPVQDNIYGNFRKNEEGVKLYLIAWTRIANSGMIYGYAHSAEQAVLDWGFSVKFVKHTVIELTVNIPTPEGPRTLRRVMDERVQGQILRVSEDDGA